MIIKYFTFFAMILTVKASTSNCKKLEDIVFAVDTTSSQTPSDFETLKSEVKKSAENFTILGQSLSRLALVSIAKTADVVVNLDSVNSLADFNSAVDKLSYSFDTADLSEGIKVAKDSVLDKATRPKASKVLIIVKDRRSAGSTAYDSDVLSRMESEAKRVRDSGAAINVVGIGGLWSTVELTVLYGTEYLLFKGKDKALQSIKSLNNMVCDADYPLKGRKYEKTEL